MEDFWFVAFAMGLSQAMFFDGWDPNFDVIGDLPYEVATDILRLLDGRSLLAAALVCRRWRDLIRSDRVLRERVRSVFAAERMANLYWRTRTRTRATGSPEEWRSGSGNAISEERRAFGIGERGKKRKFANEASLRGSADGARPKTKKAREGGCGGGGESWTTKSSAMRLR